ncbi:MULTISPECIES: helix-turn-helix transcriptional regulator [unclassified Microbacterium]|uniref:helix-turn-helix domain-containing protein n=1 Tax=unclassified Microbacterium TaxID=2609290 RepID=UPI002468DB03|nr:MULTISPECIES: helix-turn-helix transcriptional regulator [unclassified Microbacterium]MDH5134624.1 helix-turn-helix transcriptional regulator [Microbacterium sp. RD10]MDH5138178.1 helix-turn-helix transcriptional regulator [Microbacterium sp. RD11]MDH5146102.1 helix-turn-helix transcriptional regulator [Microbacterium sp. RD12]MDH5156151.1 helix-turn-helix transcriptional regulator [Microbacterium sp. RD06]MDH5168105.1 helix-turn-helix transcriptional regulator [Microbacterium sp. RD02]
MPSPRAALGVRVRQLREALGLSQEAFAHRAELDRTYVSGIERGRRNPTLDVLYRLADALEVEVRDLFPGKP